MLCPMAPVSIAIIPDVDVDERVGDERRLDAIRALLEQGREVVDHQLLAAGAGAEDDADLGPVRVGRSRSPSPRAPAWPRRPRSASRARCGGRPWGPSRSDALEVAGPRRRACARRATCRTGDRPRGRSGPRPGSLQAVSRSLPTGLTTPRPVTTTRRCDLGCARWRSLGQAMGWSGWDASSWDEDRQVDGRRPRDRRRAMAFGVGGDALDQVGQDLAGPDLDERVDAVRRPSARRRRPSRRRP